MELTNINTIKTLMAKYNVNFSKSLGQNFLTNPTVCPEMADYSVTSSNIGVIEIGPGVGVLTKELALRAKKVVAIELDRSLLPLLKETLLDFSNIKIIQGDALKIDISEILTKEFPNMEVVVCANLPYYITSPLIMKLLESRLAINSITAMVQKEAAVRLCAAIPSREVGAVSIAAAYYANRSILFDVPKESFIPQPKVESAVIKLDIYKESIVNINAESENVFFRVVKSAFSQRRKNLSNSLSSGLALDKAKINKLLENLDIPINYRAEQLSLEQFAKISNTLINDNLIVNI